MKNTIVIKNINNIDFEVICGLKKYTYKPRKTCISKHNEGVKIFQDIVKQSVISHGKGSLLNLVEISWVNELEENIGREFAFYSFLKNIGKSKYRYSWRGSKNVPEYRAYSMLMSSYYRLNLFYYFKIAFGKVLFYSLKSLFSFREFNQFKSSNIIIHGANEKYLDIIHPLIEEIRRCSNAKLGILSRIKLSPIVNNMMSYRHQYLYKFNLDFTSHFREFRNEKTHVINSIPDNIDSFYFKQIINRIYAENIFKLSNLKSNITSIIEKGQLEIFGSTNHVEELPKMFYVICKSKNISTFGCKRGLTSDSPDNGMFLGDKLFVKSKFEKRLFIKRGLEYDKIFITGLPSNNELILKNINRKKITEKTKYENGILDEIIILYLPQPCYMDFNLDEKKREISDIAMSIMNLNAYLIIKLHPNETNINIYDQIFKQIGFKKYKIYNDNLFNLLISCDIALTKHSGTGIDALVIGKELMVMNYTHRTPKEINLFKSFKVGIQVNSKNDLANGFKKIINSRNIIGTENSSCYEYIGPQDLNSAKRIISELIPNNAKEFSHNSTDI